MERLSLRIQETKTATANISLKAMGLYVRLYLEACGKTADLESGLVEIMGKCPTDEILASTSGVKTDEIQACLQELKRAELIELKPLRIKHLYADNEPFFKRKALNQKRYSGDDSECIGNYGNVDFDREEKKRIEKIIKEKRFPLEEFKQLYVQLDMSYHHTYKEAGEAVVHKAMEIEEKRGWSWLIDRMKKKAGEGGKWSWVVRDYEGKDGKKKITSKTVDNTGRLV